MYDISVTMLNNKTMKLPKNTDELKQFIMNINEDLYGLKRKDDWPQIGDIYYGPAPYIDDYYYTEQWYGTRSDAVAKQRHLICRTREEAIEKAKKMLEAI